MGEGFRDFTVAAVQAAPIYLDRDASIDKACSLIEDAGGRGSDLAVFGETWVSGYASFAAWPSHPAFGHLTYQLIQNGVEVPSPATDALCRAARRAGTDVAIGIAERDATTRGTIYCTLLFIGREGKILGKHRKLKPTMFERTLWGEGDGSTLQVYDRPYGRLGGLNCWEHQMVLPGYSLIAQGIQVHAGAWPGGDFTRQEVLSRAFAMQSGAYVVMAGALIREQDLPPAMQGLVIEIDGQTHRVIMECNGGSGIISPNGDMLAGPLYGEEGILTATVNPGVSMLHKMIADHAGHYTRPDVFELRINARPKRIATFDGRAPQHARVVADIREGIEDGAITNESDLRAAINDIDSDLTQPTSPSPSTRETHSTAGPRVGATIGDAE